MRLCVVAKEGVMIPEKVWVQIPDDLSYWQYIKVEHNQRSIGKEAESECNCVPECHKEKGNSGEAERKSNCVVESHTEDGKSDSSKGQNVLLQASANGAHTDSQNVRPVEAETQWQLVSHSKKKKKRGVTSPKDTTLMGKAELASHSCAISSIHTCDNSDVSVVSIKGLINSAEEGSKRISLDQISGHSGRAISGISGSAMEVVPVGTSDIELFHAAAGMKEVAAGPSSAKKQIGLVGNLQISKVVSASKVAIEDGPNYLSKKQVVISSKGDKAENGSSCVCPISVEKRSIKPAIKLIPRDFSQAELNIRNKVAAAGQFSLHHSKVSDGDSHIHKAIIVKDQPLPHKGASHRVKVQEIIDHMLANPQDLEPFNDCQRKAGLPIFRGNTFVYESAAP